VVFIRKINFDLASSSIFLRAHLLDASAINSKKKYNERDEMDSL